MRTEAPARRAGRWRNHDQQDVQARHYSTMLQCRAERRTAFESELRPDGTGLGGRPHAPGAARTIITLHLHIML
jgi:protein involved in temperature-dependent protein secretion